MSLSTETPAFIINKCNKNIIKSMDKSIIQHHSSINLLVESTIHKQIGAKPIPHYHYALNYVGEKAWSCKPIRWTGPQFITNKEFNFYNIVDIMRYFSCLVTSLSSFWCAWLSQNRDYGSRTWVGWSSMQLVHKRGATRGSSAWLCTSKEQCSWRVACSGREWSESMMGEKESGSL